MNYIYAKNLCKHYPDKILFENLSFGVNKGNKVALIANNGTGKSSLLKILAGKDTADSGEAKLHPDLKVGFLEQEPAFNNNLTINELINSSHSDVMAVIRSYEKAMADQTKEYNDKTHNAFEAATHKMEEHDAWDYERRLTQMLTLFNIHDLDQKIGSLSGGQKKRLALALVLLDKPELLILDEPTNHLDIDMIEWLENHLVQTNVTLLMVTHDRYFLDRICNHILELSDGKLYHHKGNYGYFLEKRAEREEVFKTETEKAGKLMKKELEWIRRMPKARTTKSKSRIDNFERIKVKAAGNRAGPELKLEVKMSRIGGKILELKKVYKSYGDIKIIQGFDHIFKKGERIGIIGKNGVGKTTFLNLLTGKEQPDSGKVNTGDTTVFGYYSQEGMKLKEDKRVIDVLKEIADIIVLANGSHITASQFLQHFMFTPTMQFTPVSKLSGGEKRRLYLMTVLMKNPNFLILDEPTNDLDLLTLNKLEEFLEEFGGCLLIVSHDRYFMDKLVDHLFIFEGNGNVRGFPGTYSEYREDEEEKEKQTKVVKAAVKKEEEKRQSNGSSEKKKLTYGERLEYEKLEKEIAALETAKAALEASLESANADYDALQKITSQLGIVMQSLDTKTMRWLELSEWVQ